MEGFYRSNSCVRWSPSTPTKYVKRRQEKATLARFIRSVTYLTQFCPNWGLVASRLSPNHCQVVVRTEISTKQASGHIGAFFLRDPVHSFEPPQPALTGSDPWAHERCISPLFPVYVWSLGVSRRHVHGHLA